jgi:hypothetical protein
LIDRASASDADHGAGFAITANHRKTAADKNGQGASFSASIFGSLSIA